MEKAYNPATGEVLFLAGNKWVKPEQTAENPKTGERAYLVNNKWEIFKPPAQQQAAPTQQATPITATDLLAPNKAITKGTTTALQQAAPTQQIAPAPVEQPASDEPPPYKDKREALDDAVNLLEEGVSKEKLVPSFAKMGIPWEQIVAHGKARKSEYFKEITPAEMAKVGKATTTGTIQASPEPDYIEGTANLFKRVDAGLGDIATSYLLQTGGIKPDQAGRVLAQNAKRRAAAAPDSEVKAGMRAIGEAKTFGDAASAIFNNKRATMTLMAESVLTTLPAMGPALALGAAGPIVRGAVAGLTSGGMEYGAVISDVLQDRKVDMLDPNAIAAALEDPEILAEMRDKGTKRGLIIGTLDALTAGIAGRFLRPAQALIAEGKLAGAAAKKATVAAWGKELATQMAGGAGGEFAAQKATGENKPAEVLLEGLAEAITGPLEVRANLRESAKLEQQAQPKIPTGQDYTDLAKSKGFLRPDLGAVGAARPGEDLTTGQPPAPPEKQEDQKNPYRSFDEMEQAEASQMLANMLAQNIPEDSARRMVAARIVENRKQKIQQAITEPAGTELEQRVKELIDTGVEPVAAFNQARQQILDERQADMLAQQDEEKPNAGQPIPRADRTSNAAPSAADQTVTTEGAGEPKRARVVPPESDVGQPPVRENAQPAPVKPQLPVAQANEPAMKVQDGTKQPVPMSALTTPEALQRAGQVLSVPDKTPENIIRELNIVNNRGGLATWEVETILGLRDQKQQAPAEVTQAPVAEKQAPAEITEAPAETTTTDTEVVEDKEIQEAKKEHDEAVNGMLAAPIGSSEYKAATDAAKTAGEKLEKIKKTRAKGAGRKPLPAEEKAAKETKRKEDRAKYQAAERKFSQNKEGALNQLDEANTPLDEGEFADEEALAQAQEDKRSQKVAAINQLLDIEEAHRGTALGKRAKAVLSDRTKISQIELDKAKKGREVRKNTNTQELMGGVNDYVSPSEGTYTTGPKFSASRKNTPRAVNPQLTGVMNGAQALTIIAKTGSWFQKLLANRLRAFVPNLRIMVLEKGQDLPARLSRASENPRGSRPWNGLFISGKDPVIYITGASFGKSNGQNNITVLHEILHAVLNNRLGAGLAGLDAKAAQFAKQITNLARIAGAFYKIYSAKGLVSKELRARVESTKTGIDANGDPIYDIFDSPDEFLAYAMTEDVVQDFLRIVPSLQTTKVVFSDFVNSAAKLLGLGKGKNGEIEVSALTDIIDATDKLLAVPLTDAQLKAADEAIANQPSRSAAPEEPEKPPVPQASVIPDDMKEAVRSAAELKEAAAIAQETVAVSRAGEEGKGIDLMHAARDPSKALPIMKSLVARNWRNMTSGAIDKVVALPSMPFLADWSGIKSLHDLDQQLQAMNGMANALQAGAGRMIADFRKDLRPFFRSAKKFRTDFENLVYETTIERVDPSDRKAKERTARADQLYKAVGPKGQEMYRKLKEYYQNVIDLYSDLLDQQIMAMQGVAPDVKKNLVKMLRQTFEVGARIRPYFPLVRRGDFFLRVEDTVVTNGKPEKVQAFYMFESVGERRQFMEELAASRLDDADNLLGNGKFFTGDTVGELRALTYANSDMLTQVFDAIDEEKFDSPEAKDALKDAIYQIYLNTMPEQKFRGQFVHRKDRAGFSTDLLRNMATTAISTSKHLAKLKYSPLMRNSVSAAADAVRGNDNLTPFVREAQRRVNAALEGGKGGMGEALAGVANQVAYFWILTAPASALIQPFSLYITALPVLGANHNNVSGAAAELSKATAYLKHFSVIRENPDGTSSIVAPSITNSNDLTDDEKRAVREMFLRGVTASTYATAVFDHGNTSSSPTFLGVKSQTIGRTKELGKEAADLLLSSLMHNTERLTREITFLAAYRLGVKRGLSHDAAINHAVDDVNEALANYDPTARPLFMQKGIGKVLLQFKMYPFHVITLLATNFIKMIPFLNKEGKKAAATKFFGMYLTAGSIAGLANIPAFAPITWVIAAAFRKAQEEEDWPEELKNLDSETWFRNVYLPKLLGDMQIAGIPVAELIDSGPLNMLTNTAIAERIGFNDLISRDSKESKSTREGMVLYATEMGGPFLSTMLNWGDAYDAWQVGDTAKMWDRLAPAPMRSIRLAMRIAEEGIKDSKGQVQIPPEQVSNARIFAQALGFRPVEQARMGELGFKLTAAEQRITNERNQLITTAKVAVRKESAEGDEALEKLVEGKMAKFNEKHPTYAIKGEDLMKILEEDMKTRAGSRLGVSVTEKNAPFADLPIYNYEEKLERDRKEREKELKQSKREVSGRLELNNMAPNRP